MADRGDTNGVGDPNSLVNKAAKIGSEKLNEERKLRTAGR